VSLTSKTTRERKDVSFDLPLQWTAGAVWRWNNRLSSSFDVSQTLWSDYAFKAEGESRKNPLDGSDYGEHPVDDCWSLRTGTEYLWVLQHTEIPLRAGLSWEQRPAVNRPDVYYGVNLGTGVSIGKGANKVIIDVAYIYAWGNDVMGTLVPGQEGSLGTDVQRHDIYVSCIYHF
jgi:long-subunit fatty acid transport protein